MSTLTGDEAILIPIEILSLFGSIFVLYTTHFLESKSLIPKLSFHQAIADGMLSLIFLSDVSLSLSQEFPSLRLCLELFGLNLSILMAIHLCLGLYFQYFKESKIYNENFLKIILVSYAFCFVISWIGEITFPTQNSESVDPLSLIPYAGLGISGIFIMLWCYFRVFRSVAVKREFILKFFKIPLILLLLWGTVIFLDVCALVSFASEVCNRIIGFANCLLYYHRFYRFQKQKKIEDSDIQEYRDRAETIQENNENLKQALIFSQSIFHFFHIL